MPDQCNHKIFNVKKENFDVLALEVFRFQYENSPVYRDYVQALKVNPGSVQALEQIPFLPVRFFKSHTIKTTLFEPQSVFESSGTTGSISSRHYIKYLALYEESFSKGFELFYGSVRDWCIIGLLPSYLERSNSSLVYMTNRLIQQSQHPQSGFYLDEYDKLFTLLNKLENEKQKTLLIGVSFALLDLAEKFPLQLQNTIVMETGGMKGRRQEMIREELHSYLKDRLGVDIVHSEYGMTELLSQAYSKGEGVFNCPPWMKIMIRDEEDPLLVSVPQFQTLAPISGAINIIDLANIYSCSFIGSDDVGKVNIDGSFEIAGRMDGSDLRGCSLMVAL